VGRGSGREILRKEAIAVVGSGWVICGLFGALPYLFCTPRLELVPALFESMSGFTTTGATVMADITLFPKAILLWRSLTQWLGGVGILVLFVALLSSVGAGSKALFQHESSAKTGGGVQARIQDVAAKLWQIYLGLSLLCMMGLMALGMDAFEAVCHAMTAISTGGFSTRNASVAAFESVGIELWLTVFMTLGGINFLLYAWLLQGRWDRWRREEETRVYLAIIVLATGALTLDLVLSGGIEHPWRALRESVFQVVSVLTTTGFTTADYDQWPPLAQVLLLLLMVIGGCTGSTAGGVKVSRWVLFLKILRYQVKLSFRPNLVFTLRLNGATVDEEVHLHTIIFIALAGVTVAVGTAVVSLLEPSLDIDSSLSAVLTTLCNVGPGLGAVGPSRNFAHLGEVTMIVLSGLMLLGRLEFFAILVLFTGSLWRKY
jgi:trk system potassium uptake protein TrkH